MPLGIYYNKEVGLGLATEWIEIGEVIMNIAKDLVSVLRPSGLKYPLDTLNGIVAIVSVLRPSGLKLEIF